MSNPLGAVCILVVVLALGSLITGQDPAPKPTEVVEFSDGITKKKLIKKECCL